MNQRKDFNISKENLTPYLYDYDQPAGNMGQYFYQDLWAARKVFLNNPSSHYDIGSKIDGFILALLSFREVTLIDIRPLKEKVQGLSFLQADATNLDNIPDSSITSLSALCSLEHFGLGRYGDDVDPEACFKAFKSIQRVMAPGGRIYISVPVAKKNRLEFNGARIFQPATIIEEFNEMTLKEFIVQTYTGETIYDPLNSDDWDDGSKIMDFGFFEFEKQ